MRESDVEKHLVKRAKELGGNRVVLASLKPGEMHERTQAMRWALVP